MNNKNIKKWSTREESGPPPANSISKRIRTRSAALQPGDPRVPTPSNRLSTVHVLYVQSYILTYIYNYIYIYANQLPCSRDPIKTRASDKIASKSGRGSYGNSFFTFSIFQHVLTYFTPTSRSSPAYRTYRNIYLYLRLRSSIVTKCVIIIIIIIIVNLKKKNPYRLPTFITPYVIHEY